MLHRKLFPVPVAKLQLHEFVNGIPERESADRSMDVPHDTHYYCLDCLVEYHSV